MIKPLAEAIRVNPEADLSSLAISSLKLPQIATPPNVSSAPLAMLNDKDPKPVIPKDKEPQPVPKQDAEREFVMKNAEAMAELWGPFLKGKGVVASGFVFRADKIPNDKDIENNLASIEDRLRRQHRPEGVGEAETKALDNARSKLTEGAKEKFDKSPLEVLQLLHKYEETRNKYFLNETEIKEQRTAVDEKIAGASQKKISTADYYRLHSEKSYLAEEITPANKLPPAEKLRQ